MHFVKMEGLGNDFIVVEYSEAERWLSVMSVLSPRLCDRHFGIGADGVIIVGTSPEADLSMRIFNADGSEAEMCGNGIRCLAKFAFERGMVKHPSFTVETRAGLIIPQVVVCDGKVEQVRVDMGRPRLTPNEIPVNMEGERVVNAPLPLGKRIFRFTAVSMGNPHVVIFEIPPDWEEWGKQIENHHFFPQRTNVEFVRVVSPTEAEVKVWERGAGATLACGTGACAVLVAGVLNGVLERSAQIRLPGGVLSISWEEDE
ncbi:MAG: diaminopimelate epimerase, partial [Candidatus Atribacteria bacterium]|nr:diaminopimelate epimerase [Candidatus Atribacteria bacterium]